MFYLNLQKALKASRSHWPHFTDLEPETQEGSRLQEDGRFSRLCQALRLRSQSLTLALQLCILVMCWRL